MECERNAPTDHETLTGGYLEFVHDVLISQFQLFDVNDVLPCKKSLFCLSIIILDQLPIVVELYSTQTKQVQLAYM